MIRFIVTLFITLGAFSVLGQLSIQEENYTRKIEFSTANFNSTLSGAKTNFSAVTTYHGNIYFVYCDSLRRPVVGKILPSGEVQTEYLDKNESDVYKAQDDDHHVFSIGVDKEGYLHVIGDAHGDLFNSNKDLLPIRYQNAPYLHWVSSISEEINTFEFVGLNQDRIIPGHAFTYFSFHNDMNGQLYCQYRSRIHKVSLPPGSNGWCMSKYDVSTKSWEVLGDVPNSTNAVGVYPAVVWEQAGHYNATDPTVSFYQGFMSDLNFDFNNRMHIAATICADSTYLSDTHVMYAYSEDGGETFNKPGGEAIEKLPIRPISGNQQGSIVDSVGNPDFDGIFRNASVVFDLDGNPAVSYLTLEDRGSISSSDRDHYRFWDSSTGAWSTLNLSPQVSQAESEHTLDCNGVITFAGNNVWNAQMHRTLAFGEEGYTTYGLPEVSRSVRLSGADERAIREENVIRWMVHNGDSLMILSSKFEPINLESLEDWNQKELGTSTGQVGIFNDVIQIESSGEGLLDDGSLDLQFINKTLSVDGGAQVRVINVDYNKGAFAGIMISDNEDGTGNFYAATIDYKGLKAWTNEGKHFESDEINEPGEWLKVERLDNVVNAYHSDNGINWVLFDSFEIDFLRTINIGLISGSGDNELNTMRADKLQVFEGGALNIADLNLSTEIKLFPNPTSSKINIEFPSKNNDSVDQLRIIDSRGIKVKNYTKNQTELNSLEVDVSNLLKGIYYIGIQGESWSRFIKN